MTEKKKTSKSVEKTSKNEKIERKDGGRFSGNLTGGLVFIFIGIIFLLNNFGILPWDVWGTLWKFWPVLLILSGINYIFVISRLSRLLVFFLSILILLLILSFSAPQLSNYTSFCESFYLRF